MKKKVLITIALVICTLLVVAYFGVGNYFYNISLNPFTDKSFVIGMYKNNTEYQDWLKEGKKWIDENASDAYITSTNNGALKLHAYEFNVKDNNNWAIVIHGYMGEGSNMFAYAQKFIERDINVLMVDLRGHGRSEGSYVGMGYHDRLDIIDWVNYIIEKDQNNKILIMGVSMGAATTMLTTGENLPQNVKLAISDCGYTSAWDEFTYKLKQLFNLEQFPIMNAADTVCKMNAGYSLKDASPKEAVKHSKTPTLFIHGSEDTFVPYYMLDEIYESAACEKEKLVVEGAEHGLSYTVDPVGYWNAVDSFITKYMK